MEPFVGQIQAFGFNFTPRGWMKCDGALLPISQYETLFSLLGTMYGGDGRTTFALPDLRGRSMVHAGNGPGLDNIVQGQRGGAIAINIGVLNLPAHSHSVSVAVNTGYGEEDSATTYISSLAGAFNDAPSPNAGLAGVNQNNVGANRPLSIRNPYVGINVCIAVYGIYPSRN